VAAAPRLRAARSVWTAARLPPLFPSRDNEKTQQILSCFGKAVLEDTALQTLPRLSRTSRLVKRLTCIVIFVLLTCGLTAAVEPEKLKVPSGPDIEKSITRGIDFLLQDQNKDGSWGSARKTKDLNIFAPVPGAHHAFRTATTAMCVAALIETGAADQNAVASNALRRAETWLLENLPRVRRADSIAIYNVWAHGYGIHALVDMYRHVPADTNRYQRLKDSILMQYDLLRRYESVDGGWGYYDFRVGSKRPATDATSFITATVLIAFDEARGIGVEPPADVAKRAIDSLNRQRKSDNTYLYGEYMRYQPMRPINRAGGSLGRSQACNLALRVWGDKTITDGVLTNWLEKLVVRNGWLSMGRKRPIPHESWFQVAAYFFYYGHYYAALCTEQLPAAQARPFQDALAAIILPLQEKDGSWWDFPFYDYHQPYGTAFALMTLQRCRKPAG
jgi:hypothetical protein